MSAPEDIPEDIWNWAYDVLGEIASKRLQIDGDSEVTITGVDLIARALLVAKTEEREACLELANAVDAIFQQRGPETLAEHRLCRLADAHRGLPPQPEPMNEVNWENFP